MERRPLWVAHPEGGSTAHVTTELPQRATVQPGRGEHFIRHRDGFISLSRCFQTVRWYSAAGGPAGSSLPH